MTRFFLLIVALLALSRAALADPLYHRPVYNPETKSYFELVSLVPNPGRFTRSTNFWSTAYQKSTMRVYKGAKGRLAIVPSVTVSDFLYRTFRPKLEVWIGLVYDCKLGKLFWVDRTPVTAESYQNWLPHRWVRGQHTDIRKGCRTFKYLGRNQLYTTYSARPNQFAWLLRGPPKEINDMFIEYPTGAE